MSSNTRQTISVVSKTAGVAVIATLLIPMAVHAASLGKMTVLSSLGQPLKAEIELNDVTKRETGLLAANLGKQEDFANAKIDMDPAYASLTFTVVQRDNRQIVEVTSAQPINLSFVNFVMEVTGGRRRVTREYSFLLDPPGKSSARTPQVATPVKPAAVTAPAVAAATTPPGPQAGSAAALAEELQKKQTTAGKGAKAAAPAAAPVAKEAAKPVDTPAKPVEAPKAADKPADKAAAKSPDHRVVKGDILGQIALRYKPKGVSLNQMLIALYRANPDAFVNNNINRLRAGQVLSLPDADTVRSIDNGEARNIVVAHTEDFDDYRNQLAGKVAVGGSKRAQKSAQSGEGKVGVKVDDKTAATGPQDKLRLSKEGVATEEDKIAAEKAVADANARVQALEKNVADLQKLLEIKSQALAPAAGAAAVAQTTDADKAQASVTSTPTVAEKDKPVATDKGPSLWHKFKGVLASGWDSVKSASSKANKFLMHLSDNPKTLPIAGGVLAALLALLAFLFVRRRKSAEEALDDDYVEEDWNQTGTGAAAGAIDAQRDPSMEGMENAVANADVDANPDAQMEMAEEAFTADEPGMQAVDVAAANVNTNLSDKIDFDLELDNTANVDDAVPAVDAVAPVMPAPVAPAPVVAPEVVAPAVAAVAAPAAPVVEDAIDETFDLDIPPPAAPMNPEQEEIAAFSVEMNMKLDLAAAYQEIGDNEGARELLEEVINSGNKELASRARGMLEALV